jgi:hypothetical protein
MIGSNDNYFCTVGRTVFRLELQFNLSRKGSSGSVYHTQGRGSPDGLMKFLEGQRSQVVYGKFRP